jgi:FkbM family methyltransferase
MNSDIWLKRIKGLLPFTIISRRRYLRLKELSVEAAVGRQAEADAGRQAEDTLRLLRSCREEHRSLLVRHLGRSRSQQLQDLFVLSEIGERRQGFFVEFGAADGREISNTWMLEQDLGWRGILAEPARGWHDKLRANRPLAKIETDCVWASTGQTLAFSETENRDLSTLDSFRDGDLWGEARSRHFSYPVRTVSLLDLMERHGAPRDPDYLSIDTEGSELEILKAFDFSRYPFKVITCEHNHGPNRDAIRLLLEGAGYARRHVELSKFDDWYVRG